VKLPAFSQRRPIAVLALRCAAALVPLASFGVVVSEAAPVSAAQQVPACATSGLVVWLDTMGNGTAGGTYYNLELTNLSGHSCTLRGYPGVSAVNLTGEQLGSAASRDTVAAPGLVTLKSGTSAAGLPPVGIDATATVVLKITDVGVYGPSSCKYVTASGLRVYPPDQTASKVVPFPFVACSRTGPVFLQVSSVGKDIPSG